jgi:hypothetical protein
VAAPCGDDWYGKQPDNNGSGGTGGVGRLLLDHNGAAIGEIGCASYERALPPTEIDLPVSSATAAEVKP